MTAVPFNGCLVPGSPSRLPLRGTFYRTSINFYYKRTLNFTTMQELENSNPIYGIKDSTGKEHLLTTPGTYTKFNEVSGHYSPGQTLMIKDGKLFTFTGGDLNPFKGSDVKLLEVSLPFVFCNISGQWFTFRCSEDNEQRMLFSTSRTYYKGINNNMEKAHEVFLQLVSDNIEIEQARQNKIDKTRQYAEATTIRSNRISQIKALQLEALNEMRVILGDKNPSDIFGDAEFSEVQDRFQKLDLILRIL
jgi:hypothetical protein